MKEIVNFIVKNEIDNYADFLMVCIAESDEWFDIAINYNTLAINKLLDAVWHKKGKGKLIDSVMENDRNR